MSDDRADLLARLDRLEARVDELGSKQEIAEIVYRASRAIDRADAELLATCFHPDATDYRGVSNGPAEQVRASLPLWNVTVSRHLNTNILIDLAGAVARVESYVHAFHHVAGADDREGQHEYIQARYLDRFERRDGAWKIARRITLWDISWVEPAATQSWYDAPSGTGIDKHFIRGRRDREDTVYHFRLPPELRHHEPDASY